MVDDHTLAEHEPSDTSGGGRVIRGPWPRWREKWAGPSEPVPPVDPSLAARARDRVLARRDRREEAQASRDYQSLLLLIARARQDDLVDVTDAVLERLASYDDDDLRALIRQRLAGHRIR